MDHHQANIYKNLKKLLHIVHKYQFYGIPFTFINSLHNYYQLLNVLFVIKCVSFLFLYKTTDQCHRVETQLQ